MKLALASMLAAGAAFLLGGCSKTDPARVLHVYNWSDYIDPAVLKVFEERFDCKVALDTYDSNEAMYAKLKVGASGYDVVFPSSYQAYLMRQEGMLRDLDHAKMPNVKNVDPAYLKRYAIDADMAYSVPYMTGSAAIGYRRDLLGEDLEHSWALFDRSDIKGRCTLLNDMRETIGAALKFLGYSANTTNLDEIAQAVDVVKRWKANIAKFENEGYKPGIATGELVLAHGYSGDLMQVADEDETGSIAYFLPKEGFTVWADDMAIPADADNVELAEAFIDFLHEPEIAALNMNFNFHVSPNLAAYPMVDEAMKADERIFIPEELMAKAETIRPLGEARVLYQKAWDEILAHNAK